MRPVARPLSLCAAVAALLFAGGFHGVAGATSGQPSTTPETVALQGESRIAISGSRTPVPPFEIDSPGSYVLTGDRLCAGDGIRVLADQVTIDLMGFSLVGPDSGATVGITMDGRRNVEIRNGTIRDFGERGIYDRNTDKTAFGKRILDVRVIANGKCGICLGGDGNLIKDCLVADNLGTGLCTGKSIITGNIFMNNTTGGLSAGSGSLVVANSVLQNKATGIFSREACTIRDNVVWESSNTGIYAELGSLVEDNVACSNNQSNTPGVYAGIRAVGDCIVRGNSARANLQNDFMTVLSGNVLEDNLATAPVDTLGNGFCFRIAENYFANNKSSGNTTGFTGKVPTGAGDGGGNLVVPCPPPEAVPATP
jgi:hypothetical protein